MEFFIGLTRWHSPYRIIQIWNILLG
jgi:hypothetical protein